MLAEGGGVRSTLPAAAAICPLSGGTGCDRIVAVGRL